MPDPGLAEVVSRAAVQENLATAPADRTRRLATAAARDVADGHFREGLKKHAEAVDVDFGGFDRKTAGFGVNIDETTGKRNLDPLEVNYKAEIEAARDLLTQFLDKGYDGLGPNQSKLRDIILLQAKRNPSMAAQINALGGNEQAFAERFLRDPAFTANLKNILNQNLEGNFDNSVLDAFDEWKLKKSEQGEIGDLIGEIGRRSKNLEIQENAFKVDETTNQPLPEATKARRYNELTADSARQQRDQNLQSANKELQEAQTEVRELEESRNIELRTITRQKEDPRIRTLKSNIGVFNSNIAGYKIKLSEIPENDAQSRRDIERKINAYTEQLTAADAQLEELLGDESTNPNQESNTGGVLKSARERVTTAQAKIDKLNAEQQEIRDLENEKAQLEAKRIALEKDRQELNQRKRLVDDEEGKFKRTYESAKALRLAAEKSFTDRIKNALGEAGSKTMNDYLQEIANNFDSSLTKMKEEEKEENTREAISAIQARWQLTPEPRQRGPWWNRRTETYRPINKALLGEDLDTLLNQGDRQLVANILNGRNNPATNAPYTPDAINSLLDNKDFITKIGPEAIKQLLGQRLLNGGLRGEDINIISRSVWGQKMIEEAMKQNTEFRTQVEKVLGADALNRHSFRERFGQVANQHPFWIYSLLGIPLAAAAAVAMSASAEVLNNQRY